MANRQARRAASRGARRHAVNQLSATGETGFIVAFVNEGRRMLAAGRDEEAMELAKRAIRLGETAESRALFVDCIKRWSYVPGIEEFTDVIVRALREPWVMPVELSGIVRGLLDHDAAIGPAIARAAAAWPRRLPLPELLGPDGIDAVAAQPILLAALETDKVVGVDIERFLTTLRAGLLEMAERRRADESVLRLACAMARQCAINEYVFDVTDDEDARLHRLGDALDGRSASPLAVAMLAAYRPLDAGTLAKRPWPKPLADLLQQSAREAWTSRRQRESIPRLTAVADPVSIAVREQYEHNPYPRWGKLPPASSAMAIDDWLRMYFPNARPTGTRVGTEVLIAGCGTGQHAVLFAQCFPGARVLAVDLSLASLSYAKAKTEAMGLSNIEYAQADILELGALGRRFDIISSSGVLHHLADPEQGWRTLLSLLQADGCMHVGLYSDPARRDIVAARDWLASRGYGPSADSIRRARQDLAAAAAIEPRFNDVLRSSDFYSLSECRDLLFHVQEHRFTIPRIAAFLEQNGLRFLGFSLGDVVGQFRRRFGPQEDTDLTLWHQFEAEHPSAFKGMYQFWVQRRGA